MKYMKSALALMVFSAALTGCANTGTQAKKETAAPAAAKAAADAALSKNVNAALGKEAQLDGAKISAAASTDGAVTLSGTAVNDWQKYLAGDIAKKTQGVKSVNNAVKVAD